MYWTQPTKERVEGWKTKDKSHRVQQDWDWFIYWSWFYDFNFFTNYFLWEYKKDKKTGEKVKSAPFHKELSEKLQSNNDTLVIVARDHAKSTTSFFVMVHDVVYKKEKSILLIMSEWLGVETIGKLRDEFETNQTIIKIFGRLVPNRSKEEANKKRTQKQLQFLNGVTLESVTMWWSIRGKRPTKIVCDDPQENKDTRSAIITENFNNWFFSSVYNTLDPTGRCILIWTVVWNLCLVNMVLNEWRGFQNVVYNAVENPVYEILEDNKKHLVGWKPLRPDKRTIEALDKRLQVIGRDNFHQEYMNIPYIQNGRPVFPQERVEKLICPEYTVDEKYPWLRIYRNEPWEYARWCDTADGGVGWDYSTITIRDRDQRMIASYQWHIISSDYIELLEYMIEYYKFEWLIGIEKNRPQVIELAKTRYRRMLLYKTKTIDKITNQISQKYGFATTSQSKPLIIDKTVNKLCDGVKPILEVDDRCKVEMQNYYYDEQWRANAISPNHDDLVMSDMICLHMLDEM